VVSRGRGMVSKSGHFLCRGKVCRSRVGNNNMCRGNVGGDCLDNRLCRGGVEGGNCGSWSKVGGTSLYHRLCRGLVQWCWCDVRGSCSWCWCNVGW
jgi:hypothetical protein